MTLQRQRRFWRTAIVAPMAADFVVRLDGRLLRTPAGASLSLPTEALAEGVAAEWGAVDGEVRPGLMPLTRIANSAIDHITPEPAQVAAMIAAYGGTDLVCYRASEPAALRCRQDAAWDPWLRWAERAVGVRLEPVTGVMPRSQSPVSLTALHEAVSAKSPFGLAGLAGLVTLSGSLVLGLAVAARALPGATAWRLSRIDETWQEERWGSDPEAAAAATEREASFIASESFLRLLGDHA